MNALLKQVSKTMSASCISSPSLFGNELFGNKEKLT